jgi:hypothetical protein
MWAGAEKLHCQFLHVYPVRLLEGFLTLLVLL